MDRNERAALNQYRQNKMGDKFDTDSELIQFYHDILTEARGCIKNFNKEKYSQALYRSMKMGMDNIMHDNPFHELVGNYDMKLPLSKKVNEKVASIQNKIAEYLIKLYPGTIFGWDIRDKKAVKFVDVEKKRESRKKLGRLIQIKGTDTEDQKRWKKEINKLMTQFPTEESDKDVRIEITTDPLEILRKSSSRKWEEESCERIGGQFDEGPFSDIEHNNAVAFIYIGGRKEPDARYMLRWCETSDGKTDVGIEPIMYPRGKPWRFIAYDAISAILKEKGYGKYRKCKTPYAYGGYSDQMGRSGPIEYQTPGEKNLLQYAEDRNISRNTALSLLAADKQVRNTLTENIKIFDYPEVIDRLLRDDDVGVILNMLYQINEYQDRPHVTKFPGIECDTAKMLMDRTQDAQDMANLPRIPGNGRMPSEFRTKMSIRAELSALKVKDECACNIYRDLIKYYDQEAERRLYELVLGRHLPETCDCEILQRGLDEPHDTEMWKAIARKWDISDRCACDILKRLTKKDPDTQIELASNASLPPKCVCEIQKDLMKYGPYEVRKHIANNISSQECACELAKEIVAEDAHDPLTFYAQALEVKKVMAENQSIPEECACEVYGKLVDDFGKWFGEDKPFVPLGVGANPELYKPIYATLNLLASNENLPDECACELLGRIAKSKLGDVHLGLAGNQNLPDKCGGEIIKNLVEGKKVEGSGLGDVFDGPPPDRDLFYAVASNKFLPPSVACEVLNYIWDNTDYDEGDFRMMFFHQMMKNTSLQNLDCGCDFAKKLLTTPEQAWKYRDFKLLHDGYTAEDMLGLDDECKCEIAKIQSQSPWHINRYSIAHAHNLPEECRCDLILDLAHDEDWDVMDAAKKNWHFDKCVVDALKIGDTSRLDFPPTNGQETAMSVRERYYTKKESEKWDNLEKALTDDVATLGNLFGFTPEKFYEEWEYMEDWSLDDED